MTSSTTSRWQSAFFALLMLIGNLPINMVGEQSDEAQLAGQHRVAEVSAPTNSSESSGLTTSSHQRVTSVLPCFGFMLVDTSRVPSLRFEGKFECLTRANDQRDRIQLIDRVLLQI